MSTAKEALLKEMERDRTLCTICGRLRSSTCAACGAPICRAHEGRLCATCSDMLSREAET